MKLLTVLLALGVPVCATAQTTLVLQPNGASGIDAEVFSCVACGYDNTNFGSKKDFNAIAWTNSGSVSKVRSLIKFDLSAVPSNALVTAANLSFYFNPTSNEGNHSGSNASYLQRITQSWDEYTVTWNNQPATTTTNQIALGNSGNGTQNYLNMDVTGHILDMLANPSQNFGFMLKLQNENVYRKMVLASSDNVDPALRPRLEITYTLPLPVSLIEFTGTLRDAQTRLAWTTSCEVNNAGFEIHRSSDGGQSFENVGWVGGHGTVCATNHYVWTETHENLTAALYYRLKQMDYDGQFTWSDLIRLQPEKSTAQVTVYPNPCRDYLELRGASVETIQSLWITDYSGRLIVQIPNTAFQAMTGSLRFDLSRYLPKSGYYTLTGTDQSGNIILNTSVFRAE